jgi:predicted dehydrogenase
VFNDTNPLKRVRVFDKGVSVESTNSTTYGEHTLLLRDGDILSPMVEGSEPLKNQSTHFLECIRTGSAPLSDGRVGRRVVSVMEAIDRSLEAGGAPQPVHQESGVVVGGIA